MGNRQSQKFVYSERCMCIHHVNACEEKPDTCRHQVCGKSSNHRFTISIDIHVVPNGLYQVYKYPFTEHDRAQPFIFMCDACFSWYVDRNQQSEIRIEKADVVEDCCL